MKVKKYVLMIALVAIVISGCEKDDDNDPASNNPTNGKTTAEFNPDVTYGTMTDQDGNVYKTVTIGTQTWMAENLRTTKYNDGTAIPNVTDDDEWERLSTGAYCNYDNTTNTDTIATYGRLYNWYAVNTGKLAPEGWHVPSDEEWTTLTNYLGGEDVAGGKLKETGTTHWNSPNEGATNESGFTALPGGYRYAYDGSFPYAGAHGRWWSSTPDGSEIAWLRDLDYYNGGLGRYTRYRTFGFSVRCLKD